MRNACCYTSKYSTAGCSRQHVRAAECRRQSAGVSWSANITLLVIDTALLGARSYRNNHRDDTLVLASSANALRQPPTASLSFLEIPEPGNGTPLLYRMYKVLVRWRAERRELSPCHCRSIAPCSSYIEPDNGSVGHGSNGSTNVNGSRGSRVSSVKHLTND